MGQKIGDKDKEEEKKIERIEEAGVRLGILKEGEMEDIHREGS
jgi:hypothetical protein